MNSQTVLDRYEAAAAETERLMQRLIELERQESEAIQAVLERTGARFLEASDG